MITSKTRTLFAAFYAAYPPTGGASAVTYNLARHWTGTKMLVQIGDRPKADHGQPNLQIETLSYDGLGERWQKLQRVPGWIFQMARIAREFRPDTIVLEGASWIGYHWALLKVLRWRVPNATIVYHAHNVEYDLRRQKHHSLVARLSRWFEQQVLREVDAATAVSQIDAARFDALYGVDTIQLANGVDLTSLQNVSAETVDAMRRRYRLGESTILFMGNYGYRPNREAIELLVASVFPKLLERRPDAQLLLLGGDVPHRQPWLVTPGLVAAEDLPALIKTAAVSVAPIFSGSGTRLKILESLGAGVPVVTSAKGMEGLPLRPDLDVARAETAENFVDAIDALLGGTESERKALCMRSMAAAKRFDWADVVATAEGNLARQCWRPGVRRAPR